jgi:VanZ family protein
MAIRRFWKPVALLLVISPFLPEVLSGATPVADLLLPWLFLPYVLVLYGVQVLVIREVATRRRLGLLGLCCLGMIYGLYNEGLRSESLFSPQAIAIDTFSTYGLIENIRVPWTLFITIWHTFFSVLLPILLVESLFPDHATEPWLPLRATWTLAILSIATATLYFFGLRNTHPGEGLTLHAVHFAFMVGSALGLWLAASRSPRSPRVIAGATGGRSRWTEVASGAAIYALVFPVSYLWAQLRADWRLFVLYIVVLAAVGAWVMSRRPERTRYTVVTVALGAGIAQALVSAASGAVTGNAVLVVSSLAFAAVFSVVVVRLENRRQPPTAGRG